MVEDAELRAADRMLSHLRQLQKSYKRDKYKQARDLLLQQALDGSPECINAVCMFKDDPQVFSTFKSEATRILQGLVSRPRYNMCLGLTVAGNWTRCCTQWATFVQDRM